MNGQFWEKEQIREFQKSLLGWYRQNKRDLPWRKSGDPYHIWVSEVMLQQTQVATVIPYYHRWLAAFPTIIDFAGASEQKVLKLWEGLGYYARARNFYRAAKIVRDRFNGRIPDDPTTFQELPGVGAYTAAAVQSIAFGRAIAAVDGNVKRVLARMFALDAVVNDVKNYPLFARHANKLLDPRHAGDFNEAMMELGALVCRPRHPLCSNCPVHRHCGAALSNRQEQYPFRLAGKKLPQYQHVAIILQQGAKLLIGQRPANGLLGGLWEFPELRLDKAESARDGVRRLLESDLAISADGIQPFATVSHTFTHFKMTLDVFWGQAGNLAVYPARHSECRWILPQDLQQFPFAGAQHKFLPRVLARTSSND